MENDELGDGKAVIIGDSTEEEVIEELEAKQSGLKGIRKKLAKLIEGK